MTLILKASFVTITDNAAVVTNGTKRLSQHVGALS